MGQDTVTAAKSKRTRGTKAQFDSQLLIKLPADLLQKIDAMARRRGVSRAGYVRFVITQQLETES